MRPALVPILLADPLPWAKRSEYAWDFLRDRARFAGGYKGALANTPNWTFTRASTGYAQTSGGVLQSFASGELRRTDKGVLIEGAGTNLCLQSQTFDNASWTKTRSSISANAVAAPDGTTTADRLAEDSTASNTHYLLQAITIATSTAYTVSVYAKAGERSQFELRFGDTFGANGFKVLADLSLGTLSSGGTVGTGYTYSGSTITALANGWHRITLSGVSAATTSGQLLIYLLSGGASLYSGDGSSGLYLWGAQLEATAYASSYVPTTTASATRAADSLTVTGVTGLDYPLTLYAEFERGVDTGTTEALFELDSGSGSDEAMLWITGSDVPQLFAETGSTGQAAVSTSAVAVGAVPKVAGRVSLNSFQAALNGTLGTEDTSGTVPGTPTRILFGQRNAGASPPYGYLRRLAIFSRALSDGELQALTAA